MKYFRMSYEEVVYKRSYINLLLLNAAIPSVKSLDEEEDNNTEPNNNNQRKKNYSLNDNGNSFFASLM